MNKSYLVLFLISVLLFGIKSQDNCQFCISCLEINIDALLNIILNIPNIGTCDDICLMLSDQIGVTCCSAICGYVGVEEFIEIINYEDPDPIYFCEELGFCQSPTSKP